MDIFEYMADKQIFVVEGQFHRHVYILNKEIDKQFAWSNEMWEISTHCLSAGPYVDLEANTPYNRTVKMALQDCELLRTRIMMSLDVIAVSLGKIEQEIVHLDKRLKTLTTTDIRYFANPSMYEPYKYVRGIISDLREYYKNILSIQKQFADLIQPTDSSSLKDYRMLLQPKIRYELLIEKLTVACAYIKTKAYHCVVPWVAKKVAEPRTTGNIVL